MAAFNHSREDGPGNPCSICQDEMLAAQEERAARQGKHEITCSGYNERACDCGLVDGLRAALAEALEQWRVWISPHASRELIEREESRIAELRAKHLGSKA